MFQFGKVMRYIIFFLVFSSFSFLLVYQYRSYLFGPRLVGGSIPSFLNFNKEESGEYHLFAVFDQATRAEINGREILFREKREYPGKKCIDEILFFEKPFDCVEIRVFDKFENEKRFSICAWRN